MPTFWITSPGLKGPNVELDRFTTFWLLSKPIGQTIPNTPTTYSLAYHVIKAFSFLSQNNDPAVTRDDFRKWHVDGYRNSTIVFDESTK